MAVHAGLRGRDRREGRLVNGRVAIETVESQVARRAACGCRVPAGRADIRCQSPSGRCSRRSRPRAATAPRPTTAPATFRIRSDDFGKMAAILRYSFLCGAFYSFYHNRNALRKWSKASCLTVKQYSLARAFGNLKVRPKLMVLHNLFFLVLTCAAYFSLIPLFEKLVADARAREVRSWQQAERAGLTAGQLTGDSCPQQSYEQAVSRAKLTLFLVLGQHLCAGGAAAGIGHHAAVRLSRRCGGCSRRTPPRRPATGSAN